MKVVVLGGGTAGAMATMHLTRFCDGLDLTQVRDPNTPPIGVGESTTAGFDAWLREVLPHRVDEILERCAATPKRGVRFEGWGSAHASFTHDFVPRDRSGLHLSARDLVDVLDESTVARQVRTRVHEIAPAPQGGSVLRTGEGDIPADLVVDARGFPRTLEPGVHIPLEWIPTNRALVGQGPARSRLGHTRAVARPYGWIFVIPLDTLTAYGYVTHDRYLEDAERDLASWLAEEGVALTRPKRLLAFPNFVRHQLFDGRVFRVGNAASFIEPLEATSLAVIKHQVSLLQSWIDARRSIGPGVADRLADTVNTTLRTGAIETSLFIGFHYACGSAFDTAFWQEARACFAHSLDASLPGAVRSRFDEHLAAGHALDPDRVRAAADRAELADVLGASNGLPAFGGFTPAGFSQIAAGIGYPGRRGGVGPPFAAPGSPQSS